MGAEVGGYYSTFGYDASMERYLRSYDRNDVADAANALNGIILTAPNLRLYAKSQKKKFILMKL